MKKISINCLIIQLIPIELRLWVVILAWRRPTLPMESCWGDVFLLFHGRIKESFTLEKTSEISKSNINPPHPCDSGAPPGMYLLHLCTTTPSEKIFFPSISNLDLPRSTTKPKALRNLGACMQWMFSSQRASSITQNMEGGWLCSPRSCYTVFFADRRKGAGDDWELCAAEKEENRRWRRVAWCWVIRPVVLTGLMCA